MPFYINEFKGGLGNQMFSIATIYSLSKRYNTTFSFDRSCQISEGMVNNRVYHDVLDYFSHFPNYSEENALPTEEIKVIQFQDYQFNETNAKEHRIHMKGLPMLFSLLEPHIEDFKQDCKNHIPQSISSNIPNLCIAMRTFSAENSPQWATSLAYYNRAIEYMSKLYDSCNIHIYTDKEGSMGQIVPYIQTHFGEKCVSIQEFCGNKETKTDVEHFFNMFQYDNYILCISTFHYWPALLSTKNADSKVIYPEEVGWYKNIVHPKWIAL